MKKLLLYLVCLVLIIFSVSCTKNNPAAPVLNLTGTWYGLITDPFFGTESTLTWQVTQTGNSIGGTLLSTNTNNIIIVGTISGTVSGTDLNYTMSVPAGGVQSPPFADCAVDFSGSATLTGTTIIGTYSGTGSGSCPGTFSDAQLSLTKQ